MSLLEEVAALVESGVVYVVDVRTGEYKDFTVDGYVVVSDLVNSGLFKMRMSLRAALELSESIKTARGTQN